MLVAILGILIIISSLIFCECGMWYFVFYKERKPQTAGYIVLSVVTGFFAFIALVAVLYFLIYPPNIVSLF